MRWVWWWCELFVQALVGSHSQLFAADALLQEGDVQQPELSLSRSLSMRAWPTGCEPAELGGASIRYYVVRRSWMASMAVIQSESESEVASTNCFLDLQSVQSVQSVQHAPIYLSVAAFTGYLSRHEKIPAVLYAVCVESGGGH